MSSYEQQYLDLCKDILENGHPVENTRTGKVCYTKINHDFVYDANLPPPILTTKHHFVTGAIAEVIGYWRKYTDAQDFADLGSKSWLDNSNKNKQWLQNPNRKGTNDMGTVYGAVTGSELRRIYYKLCKGEDDRGLIYQMWRPETFSKGCLRPCAFEHIWSLVDGKLSLTVTQRSADLPLGVPFNSVSFYFLLKLMAKITGNIPDKVYHKLVNVHVYEDQVDALKLQLSRTPLNITPSLEVKDWVKNLDDVLYGHGKAKDYFTLTGYEHQGKIEFPFSE